MDAPALDSKVKGREYRGMVAWLFPTARIPQDPAGMRSARDIARGPDVIKAAALVCRGPVLGTVGPP